MTQRASQKTSEPIEDKPKDGLMTIGALAAQCGVTVRTLRYYEEMDLIGPVKRTDAKYRLYNRHSLKRAMAILALQELNFSLDQVLEILGPYSKTLLFDKGTRIQATRSALSTQKSSVETRLDSLQQLREEIDARLNILESACMDCMDKKPATDCEDNCQHRDIHTD